MEIRIAAGAVIYRVVEDVVLFLMIFSIRNKIWGFPKGHLDAAETEMQAAIREIYEEAGLKEKHLVFKDGFREEDVYLKPRNKEPKKIEKHSIYFLAEAKIEKVKVCGDEISEYKWATLDEGLKLLSYDGTRNILKKAHTEILEKYL